MNYNTDRDLVTEHLLESTINEQPNGICWLQSNGRILYLNDAFAERLELREYQSFNLNLRQLCPDLDANRWRKLTRDLYSHRPQLMYLSFQGELNTPQQLLVTIRKTIANQQTFINITEVDSATIIQHPLVQQLSVEGQIGIWTWQLGQTQLQVNAIFKEILQLSNISSPLIPLAEVQEIVRHQLSVEDRTQAIRNLHLLRTEFMPLEFRVHTLNNQQQILVNAYAEAKNNQLFSCFGTVRLLKKEKALLPTEQFATKLLRLNPQPSLVVTEDLRIISGTVSASTFTNYAMSELQAISLPKIFPQFEEAFNWSGQPFTTTAKAKLNCLPQRTDACLVELTLQPISHQGEKYYLVSWIENNPTFQSSTKQNVSLAANHLIGSEIASPHHSNEVVSQNADYQKVMKQVSQVAQTEATVLILGETGTGKELLARAVHQQSNRSAYPLVKINCAALPENLIESELFGHEKGAFTGAVEQKIGRFELADKGTIFLDEIGELPLDLQPKLLRVLQEGEFERVGSSETIKIDARVVAATNRDLVQLINKGKFREDLYYRLNVFPIENIPLRQRRDDIPLLAKHFVKVYSGKIGKTVTGIQVKAMNKLLKYDFPGNIRELENIIERGVILTDGKKLSLAHWLPQSGRAKGKEEAILSFEEAQKQHIIKALKKTKWRVSGSEGAAKLLQMNAKTLESKMRKYGLIRKEYFRRKSK